MKPWLSVVGIGSDGVSGLSAAARTLVEAAEVLVGGERHLAMVGADHPAERLAWRSPFHDSLDDLNAQAGRRVVVLATGDPLHYGVGTMLARRMPEAIAAIIPAPGAFSLAAARMRWPLSETDCISVHNRAVENVYMHFHPGARLLILTRGGETPAQIAAALCQRGYGPSRMTVLEYMGGPREARRDGTAEDWGAANAASLNTVAVDCAAGPDALVLSRLAGLPDESYENDGQLTKREVRAATLAALAPLPGRLLWDVGAGCGSIAIEWMRAGGRAIAVECHRGRAAMIARNAAALGVPDLDTVIGKAPAALDGLETPDAIFIGGGIRTDGMFDACWDGLRSGGRLVANTVTADSEALVASLREQHGGILTRIAISHAAPAGGQAGWQPKRPVTQWSVVK